MDKKIDKDPYCYEGTEVLINNLNIRDNSALAAYERAYVSSKLLSLYIRPNNGDFSVNHYLGIHKYLFNGVYPFAGKIRTVDIIKGETYFARRQYVEESLKQALDEMKEKLPTVSTLDEYAGALATYYIDLNIVHPFREGNGRCEREFFREYVNYLNPVLPFDDVSLNYSEMNKGLLLIGTIKNNDNVVKQEFLKALTPIEMKKQK